MKIKNLIVGAGLCGAVLARKIASDLNEDVTIVDSHKHIAGHCYDYKDENNINIHKYGPHIFHTDFADVWQFLSEFTEWTPYFHKVEAIIDGNLVPIPFNLVSIEKCFPTYLAKRLSNKLIDKYGFNKKISILELRKENDVDLKFLAEYIYEKVFLGYTVKQWGKKPEEIDPAVSERIPIYISKDCRYFQDKYQAIPTKGYSKMIENILDHKLITIKLDYHFSPIKEEIKYDKLIYTGAIDEFFDYKFGKLEYRSIKFKYKTYNTKIYQPVAQVNYPNNYDFTRITEYKHFLKENTDKTSIAEEYPEDFIIGKNDRYYPFFDEKNINLHKKYLEEAKKLKNVFFVGRLADYKYYDMDDAINRALNFYTDIFNN